MILFNMKPTGKKRIRIQGKCFMKIATVKNDKLVKYDNH